MPEHCRPSCSRLLRVFVLLLATLATHPVRAEPVDVVVPLQLDDVFLSQAVAGQVYTDAGGSARVWDDGSGCNHMVLTNPRIDAVVAESPFTSRLDLIRHVANQSGQVSESFVRSIAFLVAARSGGLWIE